MARVTATAMKTTMTSRVRDYLAQKRALGFKLKSEGLLLLGSRFYPTKQTELEALWLRHRDSDILRTVMEKILANALGQDVSKLAAQEKRLLLSRLLARFAHEVRNPLSSLDIHVQLLEEDIAQAPPQVREKTASRFEIIHGELHRLENIVKHFLSLAGPSSLDLHPVEVAKVVSHVCELLRPEAASRGIEIVMQLPDSLPSVPADAAQLTQALVNLVINALQAVEHDGRVEVTVRRDEPDGVLTVAVRDTGPGIPTDKQSAIFEPYFTTKAEGSGLGLWIVQQIVTAHGGAVEASNAADGGAVFAVHLPLQKKKNGNG
jgi:two-component system sensor histidine kinase HydH